MKNIMLYCFFSVKHRLKSRIGYFDLYGFDFLVDENMKVYSPCARVGMHLSRFENVVL